jgi:6-phosphogluconolactonase (cycloisomerase 2 family)
MSSRSVWKIPVAAAAALVLVACWDTGQVVEPNSDAASFKVSPELVSPGAVYVMTNDPAGNEVFVFNRAGDGVLTPAGTFATDGVGSGGGLGNQGAVVLSGDNRWLFLVNAGSHEISSFAVRPDGLELVSTVWSGGMRPVSLTVHKNLLYALNAAGAGNIAGFTVGQKGALAPLAGSIRPLSGAPVTAAAQVQFSPDGRFLVVTEKATNTIDTYLVGSDGLPSPPNPQPSNGATPFGFDFGLRGDLIVSEAFGGGPGLAAASSYRIGADGTLHLVSGSLGNTQTAACWAVVTQNGRFAYTANTPAGSISGYRIGKDGSLSLVDADGLTGVSHSPLDVALSNNSRFLYAFNSGEGTVSAFRVEADGGLTHIGDTDAVLVPGVANGIAAR